MCASRHQDQHVEVMIKRYDTFGLSAHLHSLKEGDTVELQLVGKDKHAKMNFPEIHLRHKHIGIVTAGTALAPMISVLPSLLCGVRVRVCVVWSLSRPTPVQIMRSVLYNAEANDTRVTLLYANRHEEDILLRKELEELWEAYPSRLTIYFLLSQVTLPLHDDRHSRRRRYRRLLGLPARMYVAAIRELGPADVALPAARAHHEGHVQ